MKRQHANDLWGKQYAPALAMLLATVAQPFDDDDTSLSDATLVAHKNARQAARALFPPDTVAPSGGEIEGPLSEIAATLLAVLRADDAAALASARLSEVLGGLLTWLPGRRRHAVVVELVLPEVAIRDDRRVPLGMWR